SQADTAQNTAERCDLVVHDGPFADGITLLVRPCYLALRRALNRANSIRWLRPL
ncbi:MAG: hypothetical protein QOD57_3281, partial [Actinomycetota bacterium]|nr:hypothetical protein [Actinomycetota bacterium]